MTKKENIIGIGFELDVQSLKTGLDESKKNIRTADKEFKAATAGIEKWDQSSIGLKAKLKQLNTTLDNQKNNVKLLNTALKQAEERYGVNSEQARRYKDKLLDAQTAVGKTERAINNYSSKLTDVSKSLGKVNDKTVSLNAKLKETQGNINKLSTMWTILKGGISGFIAHELHDLVLGMQRSIDLTKDFRKEIAQLDENAIAGDFDPKFAEDRVKRITSITGNQQEAVTALSNLMRKEFKDAKVFDSIIDELLGATIKFKGQFTFDDLARSLNESFNNLQIDGSLADLLSKGGYDVELLKTKIDSLTTASEKQRFILDTLSSLGLGKVIERYKETNKSLIDANEASYKYQENLSKIAKQSEPLFIEFQKGINNILNSFSEFINEIDLEPIRKGIESVFNWIIQTIVPTLKEFFKDVINSLPKFKTFFSNIYNELHRLYKILCEEIDWQKLKKDISELFDSAITKILPQIVNCLSWIIDNRKTLLLVASVLGGLFIGAKIAAVVDALLALIGVIGQIAAGKGIIAGLIAALGGPVTVAILAIGALTGAFMYFWTTSEEFRNFWLDLWDKIQQALTPVIKALTIAFNVIKNLFGGLKSLITGDTEGLKDAIKNILSLLIPIISSIIQSIIALFTSSVISIATPFIDAYKLITATWSNLTAFFNDLFESIIESFTGIIDSILDIFIRAYENVCDVWTGIKAFFRSIVQTILNIVKTLPNQFIQIGFDIMRGLITGIQNGLSDVINAIVGVITSAIAAAKGALGIASPSKVMKNVIGKNIVLGISKGIIENTGEVEKDVKTFNKKLSSMLTIGINANIETIKSDMNKFNTSLTSSLTNSIINSANNVKSSMNTFNNHLSKSIKESIITGTNDIRNNMHNYNGMLSNSIKSSMLIGSDSIKRNLQGYNNDVSISIGNSIKQSVNKIKKDMDAFNTNLAPLAEPLAINPRKLANMQNVPTGDTINNVTNNFNQSIHAPKQLSRIDIYRQSRNLLNLRGGY